MKTLQNYLALTIIKATGIVLLILSAVSGLIELLRQISEISGGHYSINTALLYVLLTTPQNVYEFFPMAGLLGSILGLGMLASRSEIVAMRASGLSLMKITQAVLKIAILLAILVTVIGELATPKLRFWAENYKALKASSGQVLATSHGVWIRDGNNFVHIDTVISPKHLYGITRYQLDDKRRLQLVGRAEQANYQDNAWRLSKVENILLTEEGIKTVAIPQVIWDVSIPPEMLRYTATEPVQMNLIDLYKYIHYRTSSGLAAGEYALAFWQRLFQPFAAAVMILLAVPFISGSLRSATMGLRLLLGIVVGFLFYLLNQFFGPLSLVFQLPPFLAALMPTLLFAIIGFILLKRTR